jgi:hypothetical protein
MKIVLSLLTLRYGTILHTNRTKGGLVVVESPSYYQYVTQCVCQLIKAGWGGCVTVVMYESEVDYLV